MALKLLFAWIGDTDLRAFKGELGESLGPIGNVCSERVFDHVILLDNPRKETRKPYFGPEDIRRYRTWLTSKTTAQFHYEYFELSSPMNHEEIYQASKATIEKFRKKFEGQQLELTYHLSPGTPSMHAIWLLMAKTDYPARLIASSKEVGVEDVEVPFDLHMIYCQWLKQEDEEIARLTAGLPPEGPQFKDIIHRSQIMKRLVAEARRLALHDCPVLLLGESGTGKELFARAIHYSSGRKDKPFISVNCGAIPESLFESELFGHKKGAFTGAIDKRGLFEEAHLGTIFLDEIGDLPLASQVKLLRALQEGEIYRVGDSKPIKVNVRPIAATNRNLVEQVAKSSFREDLFYRLAVGVLTLPPLREKKEDLPILTDHFMVEQNRISPNIPGWIPKKLDAGARNALQQHHWPGNVRELMNTLIRAAIKSHDTIRKEDIEAAIFSMRTSDSMENSILNKPLGGDFNIKDFLALVAKSYLERALKEAGGKKTKAAELLGFPNYQSVGYWMKRYDVKREKED